MTDVITSRQHTGMYSFSSQPKVAKSSNNRKIQNVEDYDEPRYANIMFDRRVVRGNTYALHAFNLSNDVDPIELQRRAEIRRRAIARRKAQEQMRPMSPKPVDGRQHQDVQTHLYLEELADKIEEADIDCQTDAFLDRPPTPLFVPAKSGQDMWTQINEGDLFDFDLEVTPLLEVLVGKCAEQALLEVAEEEELARLRRQQHVFEEMRQAELLEQQRLVERAQRIHQEKERRKNQAIENSIKDKELQAKVAANAFAKAYLTDLVPNVFTSLEEHGYLYDQVERDIEDGFLPWLMESVQNELLREIETRLVVDALIKDVVNKRLNAFQRLEDPDSFQDEPIPMREDEASDKVADEETIEQEADMTTPIDAPASEEPATENAEDTNELPLEEQQPAIVEEENKAAEE